MSAVDDFVALVDGWLGENERERLKIQQLRAAALAIAAGESPPASGTTGTLADVVADLVALRMQLLGLVDRVATGATERREPPRDATPAAPCAPSPAAPGRAGRQRTADDVRALCADLDPTDTTGWHAALRAKGVPRGSTHSIIAKARRLGILPEIASPAQNGNGTPPHPEPSEPTVRGSGNGSAPTTEPRRPAPVVPIRQPEGAPVELPATPAERPAAEYSDARVRDLWEALDPGQPERPQLLAAGVPEGSHATVRTRARKLGLRKLAVATGDTNGHKAWKPGATSGLSDPDDVPLSKRPTGRPSTAVALGCASCDHTAPSAGAMESHTRDGHGRPSTKAERTPLTRQQALERGVAS